MRKDKFMDFLEENDHSFSILPDGRILIDSEDDVDLGEIQSIPSGILFKNSGKGFNKDINKEEIFKNSGNIRFDDLESISAKIVFSNKGNITLGREFPIFSKGTRFENRGDLIVFNNLLNKDFFIEGIKKQKVLNSMIEQTIG